VSVTLLATALTFVGCGGKQVKREDPQKDTHVDSEPGLFEVEETAQKMKDKLAAYRFPDAILQKYPDHRARARLMSIRNETDRHFNVNILTDKVREILMDTDKIVFVTDADRLGEFKQSEMYEQDSGDVDPNEAIKGGKGAGAHYAMIGRLKNLRKANSDVKENTIIFTLELHDQQRREVVIIANKEFRLSKS
jgi:PBP1b-binding outer membrane lipoprotein LpoB